MNTWIDCPECGNTLRVLPTNRKIERYQIKKSNILRRQRKAGMGKIRAIRVQGKHADDCPAHEYEISWMYQYPE